MASPVSHFPADALSADPSNHGLWTAPQEDNCDNCGSRRGSSARAFSFSGPAIRSRRNTAQKSSDNTAESNSAPESPISSAASSVDSQESRKTRNQGKRIAQIVKLKPECVEEYKKVHASVWPEVLKQIKNSCIKDYHIFHDKDTNLLFATFVYVGYGFADDMERMRENKTVQEWWALTDGMQESLVEGAKGSAEGAWWKEVESVFYTA